MSSRGDISCNFFKFRKEMSARLRGWRNGTAPISTSCSRGTGSSPRSSSGDPGQCRYARRAVAVAPQARTDRVAEWQHPAGLARPAPIHIILAPARRPAPPDHHATRCPGLSLQGGLLRSCGRARRFSRIDPKYDLLHAPRLDPPDLSRLLAAHGLLRRLIRCESLDIRAPGTRYERSRQFAAVDSGAARHVSAAAASVRLHADRER